MEREDFDRSLRAMQRQVPFRPFMVALVNGDRVRVDQPEAMVVRDGVAAFIAAGGLPTLFDHNGVSLLAGEPEAQASE